MKRGILTAMGLSLLCGLTACMNWTVGSSRLPDQVLYERAVDAAEKGKYDIAGLSLQTLINTYPDSEYAVKAKKILKDPKIASCGESWIVGSQCGPSSPQ